jgi:hypothetical protein
MAWWLDVLKRGWLPESERSMPEKCPGKPLYEHYIAHAQRTGVRHRQIETQIGIFLKRMIPMLESRVERWTRNDPLLGEVEDRGTVYFFPPLCDCRQAFEKKLQQLIEWGVVNCWGQDIDTPF